MFFTARLAQEARANLRRSEDAGKEQADRDNRDVPGRIQPIGGQEDPMEKVEQQLMLLAVAMEKQEQQSN